MGSNTQPGSSGASTGSARSFEGSTTCGPGGELFVPFVEITAELFATVKMQGRIRLACAPRTGGRGEAPESGASLVVVHR